MSITLKTARTTPQRATSSANNAGQKVGQKVGNNGDTRRRNGFCRATDALVAEFGQRQPVRAGSLVISMFGDSIAPHGGTVWLGSLIDALEPLGITQRSVRTAVFRLSRDGWLKSEPVGRRSYYSITPEGRGRFREASRRIYSEPRQQWSGQWCMVMLSGIPQDARETVRRELKWLGFAPFNAGVMAHPAPDLPAVEERLRAVAGADRALLMQATIDERRSGHLSELVREAWSLDELGERYARFLERFRGPYRAASQAAELSPAHAFRVRTLLIHEYRRILLRDPMLPEELLPGRWDGVAAYQLCRNLYMLVSEAAEQHLSQSMETADGPLPPAEPGFFQRFGGLSPPPGASPP